MSGGLVERWNGMAEAERQAEADEKSIHESEEFSGLGKRDTKLSNTAKRDAKKTPVTVINVL